MQFSKITALVLILLLITIFVSCDLNTENSETKYLEDRVYESVIQKEDCYLCGYNLNSTLASYWGEINLGLLNLNTFECKRFEVNRYDNDLLIEKKARYGSTIGSFEYKDGSAEITYHIDSDRGYFSASIILKKNSFLMIDKMKSYLCTDCLSSTMNQYLYDEDHWNIAVVDFQAKEIRPLERGNLGFQCSDYYVSCYYDDRYNRIDVTAFYCPVRYTELGYDENEDVLTQILNYCHDNGFQIKPDDQLIEFISNFSQITSIWTTNDGETIGFKECNNSYKELIVHRDGSYQLLEYD